MYLPWVLCAFDFIANQGGMQELIGILVGHLYFFLKFKYPQEFGGADLLKTPQILEYYFPPSRSNIRGFGVAPSQPAGSTFRAHSWGRGNVLGQ